MEQPRTALSTPSSSPTQKLPGIWTLAFFSVSEDATGVQGFTCMDHQTGNVWALFVIDDAQGQGHGTRLLDAGLARLREAGHRQAFLTTGSGTKAAGFYRSNGWQPMGTNFHGEVVFRLWL